MHTLQQVAKNPSGWDSESNYLGEPLENFSQLFVVMTRNRDSGLLTNHNWDVALGELRGESENVVIHRFGHWAYGWWEALCVTPEKQAEGQAIVDRLEDYPLLDEGGFSEKEWEAANKYWDELSLPERVELCQQAGVSVFAARHSGIPSEDDSGYIYDHCRPEL